MISGEWDKMARAYVRLTCGIMKFTYVRTYVEGVTFILILGHFFDTSHANSSTVTRFLHCITVWCIILKLT